MSYSPRSLETSSLRAAPTTGAASCKAADPADLTMSQKEASYSCLLCLLLMSYSCLLCLLLISYSPRSLLTSSLRAAPTTGAASCKAADPADLTMSHKERSSSPILLAISLLTASPATLSPAWRAPEARLPKKEASYSPVSLANSLLPASMATLSPA